MNIPRRSAGSILVTMTLLILILVPVVLVFARWILVHRKAEMGARVHVRQYYAALGGAEVALRRLTTASPAWRAGLSQEYAVRVDTTTTVAIAVTPLGPP